MPSPLCLLLGSSGGRFSGSCVEVVPVRECSRTTDQMEPYPDQPRRLWPPRMPCICSAWKTGGRKFFRRRAGCPGFSELASKQVFTRVPHSCPSTCSKLLLSAVPITEECCSGVLGCLQREDGHSRGSSAHVFITKNFLIDVCKRTEGSWCEVQDKLRRKIQETGALPETVARHIARTMDSCWSRGLFFHNGFRVLVSVRGGERSA